MDYMDGRKAKRPRVSSACSICRKRKVKCDKRKPTCLVCERHNVSHLCEYNEPEWSRMLFQQEMSKAASSLREQELNDSSPISTDGGDSSDNNNNNNNEHDNNLAPISTHQPRPVANMGSFILQRNMSNDNNRNNNDNNTNANSTSKNNSNNTNANTNSPNDINSSSSNDELDSLRRKVSDLERIIQCFSNSIASSVTSSLSLTPQESSEKSANSASPLTHDSASSIPTSFTPNSTSSKLTNITEVVSEQGETLSFIRSYINCYSDSKVAPNVALLSGRSYCMKDPIFAAVKASVNSKGNKAGLLQIYLKIMNVKSVIKTRDLDAPTEAAFKQKILQLWSTLSVTEEEILRQKKLNHPLGNKHTEKEYEMYANSNKGPLTIYGQNAKSKPIPRVDIEKESGAHNFKEKIPVLQNIEPTISINLTQKSNGLLSIIPMKVVMSSYSKEFELKIVKLAMDEAPKERTTWLLVNRFFKYIHPFAPYIDQKNFEKNVKKLIGARSKKETKIKLKISNRLDLLQASLLFMVLVFGSHTLYSSTRSEISHEDDDDIKYLLDNPISSGMCEVPKKCMTLFQIIRWSSLEFLQLSIYSTLLQELQPSECDLADHDVMTTALEQMAISLGFHRDPSNFVDITACEETKNLWRKIWHFIKHGLLFKTIQYTKLTSLDLENQYDTRSPVFLGDKNANNLDLEIEKASVFAIHQSSEYYRIVKTVLSSVANFKSDPNFSDILEMSLSLDNWVDKQFGHADIYENLLKFYDPKDPRAHYSAIKRLNSLALLMEGTSVSVFLHYHIFLHYEKTHRPNLAFDHYKIQFSIFLKMTYTCLAAGTSINSYFGEGFDLIATPLFLSCMSRLIWSFSMSIVRLVHLRYWLTLEASLDSEYEELLENFTDRIMKVIYVSFTIYTKVSHNYYFAWIINKVHSFIYFLMGRLKTGIFSTNNEPNDSIPDASVNVFYLWGKPKIQELFEILKQEESYYLNHLEKREMFVNPSDNKNTNTGNINTDNNATRDNINIGSDERPTTTATNPRTNDTGMNNGNRHDSGVNNENGDAFTKANGFDGFSRNSYATATPAAFTSTEDWPTEWLNQENGTMFNDSKVVDQVDSTWLNKIFDYKLDDMFKNMQPKQSQSQPQNFTPHLETNNNNGSFPYEETVHHRHSQPHQHHIHHRGQVPHSLPVPLTSHSSPSPVSSFTDPNQSLFSSTRALLDPTHVPSKSSDARDNRVRLPRDPPVLPPQPVEGDPGGNTENLGFLLDDVDQVLRKVFNDIGMM